MVTDLIPLLAGTSSTATAGTLTAAAIAAATVAALAARVVDGTVTEAQLRAAELANLVGPVSNSNGPSGAVVASVLKQDGVTTAYSVPYNSTTQQRTGVGTVHP